MNESTFVFEESAVSASPSLLWPNRKPLAAVESPLLAVCWNGETVSLSLSFEEAAGVFNLESNAASSSRNECSSFCLIVYIVSSASDESPLGSATTPLMTDDLARLRDGMKASLYTGMFDAFLWKVGAG